MVIGPESRGDSSDRRNGITGEVQDKTQPCAKLIIFAVNIYFNLF